MIKAAGPLLELKAAVLYVGAAATTITWPAAVVGVLLVVLTFAWRIFQRPDLARDWIKIGRELRPPHSRQRVADKV